MMVLMALVTTFMTGPALDLINWAMPDKAAKHESTTAMNSEAEKQTSL
jgi:hypothetical protein